MRSDVNHHKQYRCAVIQTTDCDQATREQACTLFLTHLCHLTLPRLVMDRRSLWSARANNGSETALISLVRRYSSAEYTNRDADVFGRASEFIAARRVSCRCLSSRDCTARRLSRASDSRRTRVEGARIQGRRGSTINFLGDELRK